ncbi:MAG TPA: heavy metal translocating P-type ATPase [Gemmatimonadales bacterium]|nr:heavy metal translocating P-type ATPase [Gemmatimonadales bacterium]
MRPQASRRPERRIAALLAAPGAVRRYPLVAIAAAGLVAGIAARLGFRSAATADLFFLATLLLAGTPLVVQTLRGLLARRFAADVVAMLAIVTAVILRQYFAGAVIVLMQSGGEALEAYAMGRASNALEALLARAPKTAHRVRGDTIQDVPVGDVRPGDLLLIRPGDLVPVDGEVIEGTAAVDQSALTGEPEPIRAGPATVLLSGSVCLDGALRMRAERPAAESQYQQIVRLVEGARREKPPLARLADRYAAWFTPITLAMCGVAYAVTHDPHAVLAVLVVATPCPLILAVPVAVIAAVSRAAELGVIVKTGAALEHVGRARVVVFDKTGTLTLGRPSVARIRPAEGWTEGDLLARAAALEQLSSHHLARAVTAAAVERGVRGAFRTEGFAETPGLGAVGEVDGRRVVVGSAAFLATRGIIAPDGSTRTTAQVAVDGRWAGAIEFADRLRSQVPALMSRLRALGVRETVMLTGDRATSAQAIAKEAGVDAVRADLLPADKVAAVEVLKKRRGEVVMVGDGINDAPALAAATVGIALGAHGAAVSAEAADIVVLVDDLSRVADAMDVSRRMRRVALQSIGVGLGVSFALMVVAALGFVTPAVGAVLQEGLDAAVILNALRARHGGFIPPSSTAA